jgi:phosphatidylglycerol:prolipoprotein diacylglycerol transferase
MWPTIPIHIGLMKDEIHLYSVMAAFGFTHLFWGVEMCARSNKMDRNDTGNFLYALGFTIVGAYSFSLVATQLLYGKDHPFGTIAVMPAVVGGLVTLVIATQCYRLPLKVWLPMSIPFLCFAHAWGRLGCFLGGCCYGKPTDSFLGMQFPEKSLACQAHGHVPVHPTQLYEMVLLVALGLTLNFAIPAAHRIYSYLLIYGLGRFGIEFLRGDDRGNLGLIPGLSPSQQFCLLFITAGAVLAWRQHLARSRD